MSATGTLTAQVEALCGDLSAIRAPRGTELNARSWQTEAPLRMLLNNLDPEVAEHPEQLIVYGGSGKAARNHAALKGMTIPRTGQPCAGLVGMVVTKTLVVSGECSITTTSTGQRGAMLRAYDKATGSEVGAVYMPAAQSGSPMTYMLNGKQYIVVAVGGGNYAGEYLAFALPGSGTRPSNQGR